MPARPRLPLPFPRSGETPQVPGGRRDEQDEGEAQGELAHPAQPGCGPRETQQRKTSKSLRLAGRRRPVPSSALPPVSVSFPCRRRRCRLPGLPPLLTARGRESQALSSCLISYVLVIFSCPSFCSPLGRSLSAAAAAAAAVFRLRHWMEEQMRGLSMRPRAAPTPAPAPAQLPSSRRPTEHAQPRSPPAPGIRGGCLLIIAL